MARVQLGESKLKAKRMRRRMLVAWLVLFLTVLLVGVLAALSWAPFMRIKEISVVGMHATDKEALEKAVWMKLEGGYLYLFARSNIFLYPQEDIAEAVEEFSTIKHVTVQADTFNSITVEVQERTPTALWCDDASVPQCYLLDETGLVYAPAALYSGDAYQKYYGPLEVLPEGETGRGQFLHPQQFRPLPALIESLQTTIKLPTEAVRVDAEGEVRVQFAQGFTVLFGLQDEAGGVMERLALALGADPFVKHTLADFEYLDLRFGDKVYYKLKGQ